MSRDKIPFDIWDTYEGKGKLRSIEKQELRSHNAQRIAADKNRLPEFVRDRDSGDYVTRSEVTKKGWPSRADDAKDLRKNGLATRSVRGVAAQETTWIPARTVDVSNYIQLDAIINPLLVQKRLLPCSRWPRAALEV